MWRVVINLVQSKANNQMSIAHYWIEAFKSVVVLVLLGPAALLSWVVNKAAESVHSLLHPRRVLVTYLDERTVDVLHWIKQESSLMSMLSTELHILHVRPTTDAKQESLEQDVGTERLPSTDPTTPLTTKLNLFGFRNVRAHVWSVRGLPQVYGGMSEQEKLTRRNIVTRAVTEASRHFAIDYVVTGSKYGHLGLITEGIVRESQCPVLVVKHPRP